jgi:hypothetical protein
MLLGICMRISCLITSYSCKPCDSKTLLSLKEFNDSIENVSFFYWNNGPILLSDLDRKFIDELRLDFSIIETIENKPLSWVYNDFISESAADRYVFLDHDSDISLSYIKTISSLLHLDVAVPVILSNGAVRSPTVDGIFKSSPYAVSDCVIAIGSGIVLSRDIAEKLKLYYGDVFDSSFGLYGVDTSFFLRLFSMKLSNCIRSIDGFEHSLSRLEIESPKIKLFRKIERSIDQGLMFRHYSGRLHFLRLVRALFTNCLFLGKFNLPVLLRAYISGKHPRCK